MNKKDLEVAIQKAIMEYQAEHTDRIVTSVDITHFKLFISDKTAVEVVCTIEIKE